MNDEAKQFQSHHVDSVVEKDRELLAVIVAVEGRELTSFFVLAGQRRMHVVACFQANRLVIIFEGSFGKQESFEFIGEGGEEGVYFVNNFLRVFHVLPEDSSLEDGYNF